jgi:hypothetical protein
MVGVLLTPELEQFIKVISSKNMYSGNPVPESVMKLFEIEIREDGGGVLVPYWIPVLQKGRGPRKNTTDHELWKKIYGWMERKNLFRSRTNEGRISEAKSVTWYINKYGNKHFRSKQFIDIYESARKQFIENVNKKFSEQIDKITMEII